MRTGNGKELLEPGGEREREMNMIEEVRERESD